MRPDSLRLVTLNTWKCDGDYPQRLRAMQVQLGQLRPDIVLLQEVFTLASGEADTAQTLADKLGLRCYAERARRKPRWHDGHWVDSCSGMAVLSRFPLLNYAGLVLPTVAADGERVAQWCQFDCAGATLLAGNVHLSHLPHEPGLRQRQLQCLLEHPLYQHRTGPALLGGDFNASLAAPEIQAFVKPPSGLCCAFSDSMVHATHIDEAGQERDLDHVLIAPGLHGEHCQVLQAQVVFNGIVPPQRIQVSDHFGICVDFRLINP